MNTLVKIMFWFTSWIIIPLAGIRYLLNKELGPLKAMKIAFKNRVIIEKGMWFAMVYGKNPEQVKTLCNTYLHLFLIDD